MVLQTEDDVVSFQEHLGSKAQSKQPTISH